jgi:hypothetical protein
MTCDRNLIDVGCTIVDNDPRMKQRTLTIRGFVDGLVTTHEHVVRAVCEPVYGGRYVKINVNSIHTDGVPRRSGFSLVPSPPNSEDAGA